MLFLVREEWGYRDLHNRTIGPKKLRSVLSRSSLEDLAFCRCAPDEEIVLTRADGLSTRASLYYGEGTDTRPGPAVVIHHGNTVLGRALPTYRVLARHLADAGYSVLIYDRLGFGESDSPIRDNPAETVEAYDQRPMAQAAFDHLSGLGRVDPERISLVTHSAGMMSGVKLAQDRDGVRGIALIGPPRRVREEAGEGAASQGVEGPSEEEQAEREAYWLKRFNDSYRFVYGRPAPEWFDTAMTEKSGPWALEDYQAFFRDQGRTAVMLVDGERESAEDRAYLEGFFADLRDPKRFVRLKNSDHYHNTAQLLGIAVYDQAVMAQLTDALTDFFESAR